MTKYFMKDAVLPYERLKEPSKVMRIVFDVLCVMFIVFIIGVVL